jgi:hypothetical protein
MTSSSSANMATSDSENSSPQIASGSHRRYDKPIALLNAARVLRSAKITIPMSCKNNNPDEPWQRAEARHTLAGVLCLPGAETARNQASRANAVSNAKRNDQHLEGKR